MGTRRGRRAWDWLDQFLPEQGARGAEDVLTARLTVGMCFAAAVFVAIGASNGVLNGQLQTSLVAGLGSLALLATPFLLRWSGSVRLAANLCTAVLFVLVLYLNLTQHGLLMGPLLASCAIPLVGVLLTGPRIGILWGVLAAVQVVLISRFDIRATPPPDAIHYSETFIAPIVVLAILGIALVYDFLKRRALYELAEARDSAECADRAKSEYVACMSHEVRTPLNVMIGMTDMLLDSPLSNEQSGLARTLRSSCEDLLRLTNDVLDLSKIEAGRLELEAIVFDVGASARGVARQLAPAAQEKGIAFELDLDQDLPAGVRGDPARLAQVLLNLLGNAIKFTSEGGVSLAARVTDERDGRAFVSFTVTDTGIGIPEDALPRLFEKFSQIDSSTSRRFGGTGLGLAISRELVQMMGGQLQVQSRQGEGSSFAFTLPLSVVTARPPVEARRANASMGPLSEVPARRRAVGS